MWSATDTKEREEGAASGVAVVCGNGALLNCVGVCVFGCNQGLLSKINSQVTRVEQARYTTLLPSHPPTHPPPHLVTEPSATRLFMFGVLLIRDLAPSTNRLHQTRVRSMLQGRNKGRHRATATKCVRRQRVGERCVCLWPG